MSGSLEKEPLERLVASSGVVIVARPADPPEREEEIDITPPGKSRGSDFPPFLRVRRRFVVEEILFSQSRENRIPPFPGKERRDETPAPGEVIEVDAQSYDYDLSVHRKRHVDRVHKITIHRVYDPEETPSGSRLLFLRGGKDGWSFTVDPGEEGIGLRSRVEKLLAARTKRE